MLLQPKKNKYKKLKKCFLRNQLIETKKPVLKRGCFGLKTLEASRISARQLESTRQTINRSLSRKGKLWISVFPSIPVTTKPVENRMGKGKGNVDHWVSVVKAGVVIFEVAGVSADIAIHALKKGANKLPIKTKIVNSKNVK